MTDKQPEALELASVAESADLAGYQTAKKANAYCLCLLEDCAQMIRRLHAELETLRAGYAAARLEIESLRAAQPAAQPSHEHQLAIMEGERNASLDAYSRVVHLTSAESRLYESAFTSGWDRRDRLAAYGQSPAQPVPAAVAWPSLQHIHDLLYTAQRTTGDAQAQAIAEARIALSDLMTAPEPVAAQRDALSDDAVRVPLDNLHADAAYLIGRLREGSMPYARAIEIIRERIDAAKAAIRARAAQGDALDAAFEAVRKKLCTLSRYSFVLDDDGLVRRVQDRTGNWIEFDEAHALFDPVAVDAALATNGGSK